MNLSSSCYHHTLNLLLPFNGLFQAISEPKFAVTYAKLAKSMINVSMCLYCVSYNLFSEHAFILFAAL